MGSTARTLVWTSPKPGYGFLKHTAASPVDVLSTSFQASVRDALPEERGRHIEWLPAAFVECPPVSSRWVERPSLLRWMLAPLMPIQPLPRQSQHTGRWLLPLVEAAADEHKPISGPQSTMVSPTAYTRLAYSLHASRAPSARPALGYPARGTVELFWTVSKGRSIRSWTSVIISGVQ